MNIASNKRAYFDYFILEKYEAGIELKGTEVKAVKTGKSSINECYVRVIKNEVFILGMHIAPYEQGNRYNQDERRTRKLLLHKSEIEKLKAKVAQNGFTLVPLSVYLKKGLVKIEIGLGKGKQLHDKRNEIAKKDQKREVDRALKDREK